MARRHAGIAAASAVTSEHRGRDHERGGPPGRRTALLELWDGLEEVLDAG